MKNTDRHAISKHVSAIGGHLQHAAQGVVAASEHHEALTEHLAAAGVVPHGSIPMAPKHVAPVEKAANDVLALRELYDALRKTGVPVDEQDASERLAKATRRFESLLSKSAYSTDSYPGDKAVQLVTQSRKLNGAAGAGEDLATPTIGIRGPLPDAVNGDVWGAMLRDSCDALGTRISLAESHLGQLRQAGDPGDVRRAEKELSGLRQSQQRIEQLLAEHQRDPNGPATDPTSINVNSQVNPEAGKIQKSAVLARLQKAAAAGELARDDAVKLMRLLDTRDPALVLASLDAAVDGFQKVQTVQPPQRQMRAQSPLWAKLRGYGEDSLTKAGSPDVQAARRVLEQELAGISKSKVTSTLMKAGEAGKLDKSEASRLMKLVDGSTGAAGVWAMLPAELKK